MIKILVIQQSMSSFSLAWYHSYIYGVTNNPLLKNCDTIFKPPLRIFSSMIDWYVHMHSDAYDDYLSRHIGKTEDINGFNRFSIMVFIGLPGISNRERDVDKCSFLHTVYCIAFCICVLQFFYSKKSLIDKSYFYPLLIYSTTLADMGTFYS